MNFVDATIWKLEDERLRCERVFPVDSESPQVSEILNLLSGELGSWLVIEVFRLERFQAMG